MSQALFQLRRQSPEERNRKREEGKTKTKEEEQQGRKQRLIEQLLQDVSPPGPPVIPQPPMAFQQQRRVADVGDSRQLSGDSAADQTNNGSNFEGSTSSSTSVGDCDLIALETVEISSEDFEFVQGVYTKSCVSEAGARGANGNGDGRASWYMTENGETVNEIFYTSTVSAASIV